MQLLQLQGTTIFLQYNYCFSANTVSFSYLQIVNQKSPKVATARKQHVTMGLEDTALHKDAAVTEEVPLTLLIELKK